jgi:hypothetical protein
MILIKTGLSLIVVTALMSISAYATADTMIENANGYIKPSAKVDPL